MPQRVQKEVQLKPCRVIAPAGARIRKKVRSPFSKKIRWCLFVLQEQNTGLHQIFYHKTIRINPFICISVQVSICISVCTSVNLYMYELLRIYCYSTKNFRNYAFVCLFKGIFVVKYKRLNCRISFQISGHTGYPANPSFQEAYNTSLNIVCK